MINFFTIAGFQRSGSTLLYNVLNAHPGIQMNYPLKPEPKYFLKHEKELNKQSYLDTFFHPVQPDIKWIGDKSTSYIENIGSFEKMERMFSPFKVILILRCPIERAVSNYKFSFSNKLETRTIEEVFLQNSNAPESHDAISVSPFHYMERSKYVYYINDLMKIIGKEDLLLLSLERLISYPDEELDKVTDFLHIPKFEQKPSIIKTNSSFELDIKDNIRFAIRDQLYDSVQNLKNTYHFDTSLWEDFTF